MITAPKGTYDVLPPESAAWRAVVEKLVAPATRAGYAYADTPMFEDTALFERGIGEATDVVAKEMYTFEDKGGRSLTLRPEGTAGIVRAALEHNLGRGALPVKLWSAGPMFRYERPQAGRTRQFFQVGIEALGLDDPALDAEVVALAVKAFEEAGLPHVTLLLNSMGDENCRPAYVERLREYLATVADELCAECNRRRETNPLRVLDEKRPECQAAIQGAPVLAGHLCAPCKEHYDAVRGHLADTGVEWVETPRLVRGLDYYRRTTFELQHRGLGAQNAVGGGGRYDGLAEDLGGDHLPGIGWALGLERVLLALKAEGVEVPLPPATEVFVVPVGAGKRDAVRLLGELRAAGVRADMAYGDRGMKGAMKAADRSGARIALIVGDTVALKRMDTGEQRDVPIEDAVRTVTEES